MKYTIIILVIAAVFFSGCTQKENNETEKKRMVKSVKEEKTVISEAETNLLDKTENRIENIRLAVMAIDGIQIAPNEVFSFNDAVGERTAERGFKKAPVIVYEEKKYDFGGGVCQVSSTLYQAAKRAGLEITERHEHKKGIDYAKKGEDAAVDYGTLDLKFVNNSYKQIKICAQVYEDKVKVEIIGIPSIF
ncbi:MAG: hypothetical protein E7407_00560 [Ruminococcaceae bacterium]|nr:hypothetical protein [Oscillospiraceae bacterium]